MINVLGDALAAGIMAHLCKKDFDKTSHGAVANAPPAASDQRVRIVEKILVAFKVWHKSDPIQMLE